MSDDLRKGFLRDFTRRLGFGPQPKPWSPRVRRDAGPHAGRMAWEAMDNVARGRWSRGRAQATLDRTFMPQPTQRRAAALGVRGFGGAGYSGGVSRQMGTPGPAAWTAEPPKPPKPPALPMAKATSLPADDAPLLPNGDGPMNDAQLSALIARELATPKGKEHFDNIVEGLEAVAKAYALPATRAAAEEVLAKWMEDGQPELRKAMSGAWLERARQVAGKAAGAYRAGASKAGDIGARVGEAVAPRMKGYGKARDAGGMAAWDAQRRKLYPAGYGGDGYNGPHRRVVIGPHGTAYEHKATRDLKDKAIWGARERGADAAGRAFTGGVARQGRQMGQRAFHGAAIAGGAGAVGAAGYGAFGGRRRKE